MSILLVGSDSPEKEAIKAALDSLPDIEVNHYLPQDIDQVDIGSTDRVIYVDQNPNRTIIDRLHRAALTLVLVSDEDFAISGSPFFPFDFISDPGSAACYIEIVITYATGRPRASGKTRLPYEAFLTESVH
jgi:hypothetical protein